MGIKQNSLLFIYSLSNWSLPQNRKIVHQSLSFTSFLFHLIECLIRLKLIYFPCMQLQFHECSLIPDQYFIPSNSGRILQLEMTRFNII